MLLPRSNQHQLAWEDGSVCHGIFDQVLFTCRIPESPRTESKHARSGLITISFDMSPVDVPPVVSANVAPAGPPTLRTFIEGADSGDLVLRILRNHGALDYTPPPESRMLDPNVDNERIKRIWDGANMAVPLGCVWYPVLPPENGTISAEDLIQGMINSGSTIFFSFSRLKHLDDPHIIVTSIAYQLAEKEPRYRALLTGVLASSPATFGQNLRSQFRQLISDPLQSLSWQGMPFYTIFLHELDQCKDRGIQQEICELIRDFACTSQEFPLRWVIYGLDLRLASNPDWPVGRRIDHDIIVNEDEVSGNIVKQKRDFSFLQHLFALHGESNPHCPPGCYIDHELTGRETRVDRYTSLALKKGFSLIRQQYAFQLGPPTLWPPDYALRHLSLFASKNAGLVSFILHFISDERANDPRGRLEECMDLVSSNAVPWNNGPAHQLDLLYHQILSDISPDDQSSAMCIIGLIMFYERPFHIGIVTICNFLRVSPTQFYQSLRGLQSLIYVPPPSRYASFPEIRHPSFRDFLKDPRRSGKNCIRDGDIHYIVASCSIKWLSRDLDKIQASELAWNIPVDRYYIHSTLSGFCRSHVVQACLRTPDALVPKLIEQLRNIDISRLPEEYEHDTPDWFKQPQAYDIQRSGEFARWLYRHDPAHPWVAHVEPDTPGKRKRSEDMHWNGIDEDKDGERSVKQRLN